MQDLVAAHPDRSGSLKRENTAAPNRSPPRIRPNNKSVKPVDDPNKPPDKDGCCSMM
jgi:hypothetical protein